MKSMSSAMGSPYMLVKRIEDERAIFLSLLTLLFFLYTSKIFPGIQFVYLSLSTSSKTKERVTPDDYLQHVFIYEIMLILKDTHVYGPQFLGQDTEMIIHFPKLTLTVSNRIGP